jgi:stage II sporulation protein E
MLVFDMYSGEGEFIKTGGVASYIKRGENVATINAGSLPAGIISTCDAKSQRLSLKQGDIIVIVSDGVTDAFRGEKAIPEILKSVETYNMKSLADYIMEQAIRKIIRPLDDMTVICALIE